MSFSSMRELEALSTDPEVLSMMRRLADYGLGVCVPHAHSEDDGMEDLPPGVVQYEEDQQVSFISEDEPRATNAVPVAWMWEKGRVRVVGRCKVGHV